MIVIGRPINGVTLNGLEYILEELEVFVDGRQFILHATVCNEAEAAV